MYPINKTCAICQMVIRTRAVCVGSTFCFSLSFVCNVSAGEPACAAVRWLKLWAIRDRSHCTTKEPYMYDGDIKVSDLY
jgi:hypothetical protein